MSGGQLSCPLAWGLFSLGFLACVPAAWAQEGLSVHRVQEDDTIRIDGALREWPRRFFSPVGRGRDGAMRVALAHSRAGLYLAADVRDDRLVRTPPAGRDEDAVVFHVAVPRGRGWSRGALWCWPGGGTSGLGRARAEVAVARGRRFLRVRGARAVEMARPGSGWSLEVFVPWSALRKWVPGDWTRARGAVALHDVDAFVAGRAERWVASVTLDRHHPERWPVLRWRGGYHEAFTAYLAERGLVGVEPDRRLSADLAGDARPEEIALVGAELVVWGPGHREGRGYDVLRLPVERASQVRALRARDVLGDGKRELLVRYHQRVRDGEREVLAVYRVRSDGVRLAGAFEVSRRTQAGELAARVRFGRSGGRGAVLLRAVVTASPPLPPRWRPARDPRAFALPRPWESTWVRYVWSGQRYVEDARGVDRGVRRRFEARLRGAMREAGGDAEGRGRAVSGDGTGPDASEVAATVSDAALLDHAQRRGGVALGSRRLLLRRDVLGGRAVERLYGIDGKVPWLVLLGPDVGGGRGYLLWRAGNENVRLLRAEAADLDGDGKGELLVWLRRDLEAFVSTQVHVMDVDAHGFHRLGAIEVGRRVGERTVENALRVVHRRGRDVLRVTVGPVRGFSRERWPFAADFSLAGVEPVKLPWRDRAPTLWGVRGGALTRLR